MATPEVLMIHALYRSPVQYSVFIRHNQNMKYKQNSLSAAYITIM